MSRRPIPNGRLARRARTPRLMLEALEVREMLTTLTGSMVTTVADNGNNANPTPGSLRAAIIAADDNTMVGGYAITFDIPGSGVQTIDVPTSLPAITRMVSIDGDSQPGSTVGSPLIVIDGGGAGAGASGLTFSTGTESLVRGLSIVGFSTNGGAGGAAIDIQAGSGGVQIEGDDIGVEPDGVTAKPNYYGIVASSASNTIGGSTSTFRNVISGNTNAGVFLVGTDATGNLVQGNYVGTDSTGEVAVGNLYGVVLASGGNTVAGDVISGNVGPDGKTGIGVLFELASTDNVVAGNRIGTDQAGSAALPNVYGVYFGTPGGSTADNVAMDTIGGSVAGAGNLISGNFIGITGNVASSLIAGNFIGLNATGTALGNGDGIFLGATGSTIGGTTPLARNFISGSNTVDGAAGTGLFLSGDSDVVEGNFVGTASTGLGADGTSNVVGMSLDLTNSTIGGTVAGAGNFVAGNTGDAIDLTGNGGVGIFGNVIGLNVQGSTLPNAGNGISLTIAAPSTTPTVPLALNDTIGGTAGGAGNTIANSAGAGILVQDNYPTGVTGQTIRGNVIFNNAKLGIDLTGTGVPTPGTLFVTASGVTNNVLTVVGVFFGQPSTTYGIDVFANGADSSGFGQAPVYLGSVSVTTNGSGFALFTPTFAAPSTPYTSFTATVTGPLGNTSEFSRNFPGDTTGTKADLAVTAQASGTTLVVGGKVTLTETVTNTGPGTANGVLLADSLPTGLVNVTVTSTAGTASVDTNNVLTASLGTIGPNQFVSVTITGTLSATGTFVDAPGVSSTTYDPNYDNNQAVQTLTVTPSTTNPNADLAITEAASPNPVTVGGDLTYVVTVTNNGPATSTNATIRDFLPTSVTFVSALPSQGASPSLNGNLLTENLGTIASGASATLTIVVKPNSAGTITNAANVSGNQFDPVTNNNSTSINTTVDAAAPAIKLIISQAVGQASGIVGQSQTFTITVANIGSATATNVTVVDTLPANVNFVGATPSQGGTASIVNGFLVENFGSLGANAVATLKVVVTPKVPGVLVNGAGVFSADAPSIAPTISNNGVISIPSGPSVIGVAGHNNNASLVISFDEALNASSATLKANYQVVSLGTTGTGTPQAVTITSVTYNAATHQVTIVPSSPLNPNLYYRLTVVGSTPTGITDVYGRKLVNPQFTAPGANFVTFPFLAGTFPQI